MEMESHELENNFRLSNVTYATVSSMLPISSLPQFMVYGDVDQCVMMISLGGCVNIRVLTRSTDILYPPVGYDVSNLLLRQRIDLCGLNNVYVLPNNMAYSVKSIHRTDLQKAKTGTMAKPASESNYDSDNVTHELNKKTTIEIGDEFVKILQDNAFNRIDGGDVIEHIEKVLEILEW
ncbi:hypothetical protein Tco_1291085, partial [Tanacetum coccineum]